MYLDELDFQDKIARQQKASVPKKTEKQQMFVNAAEAAQQALTLLDKGGVSTGIGQGFVGGLGERTGMNSATQQQYRSTIAIARTIARNAMLGANMTEKELESIAAFIPEYSDAPNIAKEKLKTFISLMSQFGKNLEGTASELPTSPQDVQFYQSQGLGVTPQL